MNGGPKRKRSAWYCRYPEDFMGGTRAMSLAARGAYGDLLDYQFLHGSVPDCDQAICRILGALPDEWTEIRDIVRAKFETREEGLVNPRMEKERDEREAIRQRSIKNGKKGGRPPKKGGRPPENALNGKPRNNLEVFSSLTQTEPRPKASTSTSTSTSTSSASSTPPADQQKSPQDYDNLSASRTPAPVLKAEKVEEVLEEIWNASPKRSRQRSGKAQVRAEIDKNFKRLPETQVLLDRMEAWKRCEEWQDDEGRYICGLHIWFKSGRWETSPDPCTKPTNGRNWDETGEAATIELPKL